jgi:hypothetical protein
MSAVLTRRRTKGRGRGREGSRQPSLFGQVVAPPSRLPREEQPAEAAVFDVPTTDADTETDDDRVTGSRMPGAGTAVLAKPTLDQAISGAWTGLLAGEHGDCPLCGAAMEPRHSAGSGVVGGRCTGCSATLA